MTEESDESQLSWSILFSTSETDEEDDYALIEPSPPIGPPLDESMNALKVGPLKSILRQPSPSRERRWPKGSKVVRIQEGPTGEYFHTNKDGTTYYQEPDLALHSHWTMESRMTQLYPDSSDSSSEDEIRILKENNNIHNKAPTKAQGGRGRGRGRGPVRRGRGRQVRPVRRGRGQEEEEESSRQNATISFTRVGPNGEALPMTDSE